MDPIPFSLKLEWISKREEAFLRGERRTSPLTHPLEFLKFWKGEREFGKSQICFDRFDWDPTTLLPLRDELYEKLRVKALAGDWVAKRFASINLNHRSDYRLLFENDAKIFFRDPEVVELRALLEMSEGAIRMREDKGLSREEALGYGRKIYGELDKHFQIWLFNEYISPHLDSIEYFSEYIARFGIYRMGPLEPDAAVLERYPPLRGMNREYRFVVHIENDRGHKSYILDPVKGEGDGFFIGVGTQFYNEIYWPKKRAARSGLRALLNTDLAKEIALQPVVVGEGGTVPAWQVVAEYMTNSPRKYVCIGHSLGAATTEGTILMPGFPLEKIALVASYSPTGISERVDRLPFEVLSWTKRYDGLSHCTSPYHLGERLIIDFKGRLGFNLKRHHNFIITEEIAKGDRDAITFTRAKSGIMGYIFRAIWLILAPLRVLLQALLRITTERFKNIYGYGKAEAIYGFERLRNRAVKRID